MAEVADHYWAKVHAMPGAAVRQCRRPMPLKLIEGALNLRGEGPGISTEACVIDVVLRCLGEEEVRMTARMNPGWWALSTMLDTFLDASGVNRDAVSEMSVAHVGVVGDGVRVTAGDPFGYRARLTVVLLGTAAAVVRRVRFLTSPQIWGCLALCDGDDGSGAG